MQSEEVKVPIKVDAKKALEILTPIPPEKFIVLSYQGYSDKTSGCAIGLIHMHFFPGGHPVNSLEIEAENGYGIRQLSKNFLSEKHGVVGEDITSVNNKSETNGYTEPEIKDRVIHLLNDMAEAGY